MNRIIIGLGAFTLTAAPALAVNPMTDVNLTVQSSGNTRVVRFHNVNDARRACLAGRGMFSNARGRLVCSHPRSAGMVIGAGFDDGRGHTIR
jgi:hypothetical protein